MAHLHERGQNKREDVGTFAMEQTQDGSWMVKVRPKGYCLGIYDTKDAAQEAIKAACKKANNKRRRKALHE